MSRHISFALAFMLLFVVSSAAAADYTGLQRILVGSSYSIEIDDGNAEKSTLIFFSINTVDGTFRASLKRPHLTAVNVSGQFTDVPEWSIPGTVWRSPKHYHMTFAAVRYLFLGIANTTTYNGDLYPLDAEPLLTGRGSYVTDGRYYNGSREPVIFFAERVYIPG